MVVKESVIKVAIRTSEDDENFSNFLCWREFISSWLAEVYNRTEVVVKEWEEEIC